MTTGKDTSTTLTQEEIRQRKAHEEYLNDIAIELNNCLEHQYGLDTTDSLRVSYLMAEKIEEAIGRNDR